MPSLSPHKIDVQQGNYVTQEMVAKLKPGMSRSQVRFVLGTPLITDVFHESRWDYVYRLEKAGKLVEQRKLTVVFEGDRLLRLDGDVIPVATAMEQQAESQQPQQQSEQTPDKPSAEVPVSADASAEAPTQAPAQAPAETPAGQPTEEKGFFGRMLEKMGF